MALLGFEHAMAVKNFFRKAMLSLGNRNEIIHCEIIIPNRNLRLSAWQTAGVEFRELSGTNLNEFILFDLGFSVDAQILKFFEERNGSKYDKVALVTDMLLGWRFKEENRYFCSEILYTLLKYELGMNLPAKVASQVSPQEFYQMIVETGLQQIYYDKN